MSEPLVAPVKVLDVEWTDGPRSIEGVAGYTAVRALVRVHGTPVGWVNLPVSEGRCAAEAVEGAILRHNAPAIVSHLVRDALAGPDAGSLEDLARVRHPVWPGPFPLVTVAVCTRDRPVDLALCLQGLRRLDYPALDVLVVDNAPSSGATEDLVRAHPEVRYVREPRPGLDWARNRAIEEARGELVAYTDDDAVVDEGWVRALAEVFVEDPDVMAVTGLVVPAELETDAQVLFEAYGGFGRGFERRFHRVHVEAGERAARRHGGAGRFGTGANMAFRRRLFERIGPFDPALDVGTSTNGGGDLEMFFRTLKEGHTLVYEPAAFVRHRHRREYDRLRTQIRNNGVGFYSYLVRAGLAYPDERWALLRLGQWWLRWWLARRLAGSFLRPSEFPRDLVLAELSGVLPGLVAYFRSRGRAQELAGKPLPPLAPAAARSRPAPLDERVVLRTMDLARPLPPLAGFERHRLVRVLATHGGGALAGVEVPIRSRPLSAPRLRDAIAQSLTAWRCVPGTEPAFPDGFSLSPRLDPRVPVSVVVATRDRPEELRGCLRALRAQDSPRPIEIVVVDNDPDSGATAPVVAEFPGVVLVAERRQGLAYARNAGFAASRGDVLVTTDDDVRAPPGWLEELLAPFARSEVAAVTGLVWPERLDEPAERHFEAYGGLGRGFRPFEADGAWFRSFRIRAVPTWKLGATANAAFRASVLREIGTMDEGLGPGTPAGCGEDTDLFYRLLQKGHRLRYEPRAYVLHRHRRTRRALVRQIYGYSKGHVAYHLTTLLRNRDPRALTRLLVELPHAHLQRAWQRLGGRSDYPLFLLLVEVAGNLAGPWGLMRSRLRVLRLGRSEDRRDRTRVAEHDLLGPGRRLTGLSRYGNVLVLARAGRRPLGLVRLDLEPGEDTLAPSRIEQAAVVQLGLSAKAIREIARQDSGTVGERPSPPISVVVCTRDRPERLADCLAALRRLRCPAREVIVVDNASRGDATARVVAATPFRYVREDRPGLDWARERGAREARHEIVAYVDDDVRVDPGWLDGLADAFSFPEVAAVTGLVLPAELETRAQRLFEEYGGMGKGMEPRVFRAETMGADERLAVHALGVGANMAFRHGALERLGGFDTSLDVGTPARGGGDLDVFARALAAGLVVRYEPGALAWHRHRPDLPGLQRQLHDNGVAFGVYLIRSWRGGRATAVEVARFGLWRWFCGFLVARLARGLVVRGCFPLPLVWAETRGALSAPFAYLAAQRQDGRIRRASPPAPASTGAAT